MNPVEVHLLCILFFWFFNLCISKQFSFSRIPVWGALFLLFGWLSVAFAYGLSNGAELLTAIWEVRALFYFLLFYIAIPQVVRTKRQLNILLWIIIGAITVKAFQGIGRFVSLGFSFQGRAALTSHEDPVFMTTLLYCYLAFCCTGCVTNSVRFCCGSFCHSWLDFSLLSAGRHWPACWYRWGPCL
jgi:hypothetical protein